MSSLTMPERFSENMKRNIIRSLCIITLVVFMFATVPVSAKTKAPEWLNNLTEQSDNKSEAELTEDEKALNEWREIKKNTKVPILLYHHITTDEFSNEEAISLISPNDFRLHMTAISVNFTPISLRSYYEYVVCDDGSISLPPNPIIVTFDDGYLSNYELAFPILKELNIPATIFVVTDTVGAVAGEGKVNNSHFTWEQAKEMEDSGLIEIQSHTVSHERMTTLDVGEIVRQMRKSKHDIEVNLGRECDMLAYPYGDYSEDVKELASKAGYRVQLLVDDKSTDEEYDVNLPSEGVEHLTRMTIAGSMGNVNVIEIIRRTMNKKVIPE